ncbi:Aste57867_13089 [Aphanomyces stellatus]|uniref:Aste57867_13089 protein n=1 Tax=Aphanomyces stellatus TaxID=120398 RepID=A0A485KXI1_9STRA|nr:hypothetical protein As57867_013041 [Aphanomyces stellatus]VFT89933.1 Aste57867_13089 [Aphanomyces stellatus]
MRGIFEAAEVKVLTSFILMPFNIETQAAKPVTSQYVASFFQRMQVAGVNLVTAVRESNPLAAAKAVLDGFTQGQPMYFYLINEITGTPTNTSSFWLRFYQREFQFLKLANTVAGFFKTLGVPHLSDETLAGVESFLDAKKSSVEDFDIVQQALHDAKEVGDGKAVKEVRGPALREVGN